MLSDLLVGVAIFVGLLGIVVPVLPGSVLILAAVLVWSIQDGSPAAWTVFAVAALLLVLGAVAKYAIPGRRLKAAGVPRSTVVVGGVLGIVGFFVIPVVGLLLGFVLGVYLAEAQRVGKDLAWPSTKAAVQAVGLSMLIELAAGLLASAAWLTGALVT